MVDAVNTVSLQGSALRSSPQGASVASDVAAVSAASSADFVTSGIVVDNLQNMAILEYRSSKTGEIIQQYPTQAQIEAFKSAEALRHAAANQKAPAPPQPEHSSGSGEVHVAVRTPPAPAPVAPAPHKAAPVQSSTGGVHSAHSVLA